MAQVVDLDAVVASRFHNVLCADVRVPTIAVGYGDKHRVLMERFGVGRFSHEIRSLDVDDLVRSLEGLLAEGDRLSPHLLDVAARSSKRSSIGSPPSTGWSPSARAGTRGRRWMRRLLAGAPSAGGIGRNGPPRNQDSLAWSVSSRGWQGACPRGPASRDGVSWHQACVVTVAVDGRRAGPAGPRTAPCGMTPSPEGARR